MNKPPVLLIDDEISKAAFSLLLKEPFYAGEGGGRLMAVAWQTQVGDSPAPWRPRNRQYEPRSVQKANSYQ